MPLRATINKDLGFPVYQVEGKEPQGSAPFNLYIYQLPDLIVKSNTTLAEYMMRQQLIGLMEPLAIDYYVDHLSIWEAMPAYHKVLKIGICGTRKGVEKKAFSLILSLAKKYNIAQNKIFFFNVSEEFQGKLFEKADKQKIEKVAFELPEIKQKFEPKIEIEVLINGTWQAPDSIHSFNGIKLKTNIGNISYRVHHKNQAWSAWVSNGQCAGLPFGDIDGFQFEFNSDDYIMEFKPTLQGRGALQWKSTYLQVPYNINILNIDFRFKER